MFSFKKKDRDRNETKEEKRERRKREKAEKESRKHDKKVQQGEPAIGDIVAGSNSELDDKKGTRFSFRKRKYDVDHEYDEAGREQAEYDVRQSYSGSSDGSIGTAAHKHGSPRGSARIKDEYDGNNFNAAHSGGSNRVSEPVPAPRRKKTSSVEIKLTKGSTDSMNGDQRMYEISGSDDNKRITEDRSKGHRINRKEHEHKSKALPVGGRTIALSGTPNRENQTSDSGSPPPKPPRVVKADDTGIVEFRLVNKGKSSYTMPNEPREIVTISSVSNDYSAPLEDFMDASMEEKPIKMDSSSPLESTSQDISIDITSPTEKSFEDLGVNLSLPEVVPASPGVARIIKIQRRLSGDFGFALRRGTESGSDKTVHFVEPVGPNTASGILPGDRLIEVNGENVEDVDREKIIEMIAMSGNEVVIKVVPVSELSELSVRSGLDGSTVQLDESNLQAGTLQRSGSKRMKKKPKSANETALQKAWQDAEKVWVVHKAGFSGGRVQRVKSEKEEDEDVAICKVKLDHGGEVVTIEEDSIEKANPPQYDRAEDLASLRYLNESSCLHTLRQRYGSNLVHTYAGPNLVVINPNQNLAIYTDKVIQMFRGCKQEDMPPHIFAAAQSAYRNMLASRVDQSVVLMGTSGSGKTTCAKHILHYLSVTAASQHSPVTDQKFEGIFTLLEAFGNSSTKLNKNASKQTLLVSLDFDSAGLLTCGTLQTFLLEKSRVVSHPEGEGPFHIFNYLLAGSDPKLRKELQLDRAVSEPNDFILDFDPKPSETHKFSNKWTEIEFALNLFGISSDEAKSIWCCLAAVFHLGGASIDVGADNKPHFNNPAAVQRAASALGTTSEELTEIIFAPPPVNQFTIRMRQKSDSLSPPSSAEATPERQAKGVATSYIEALEGFAIGLYQEAFSVLIKMINRSLQCNVRSVSTIHVLDSPGFQNPSPVKKENGASFEDLCHNYESERLQKFFHHTVFTAQMERYTQENIECSFESVSISPDPVVSVFDRAVQGLTRGSTLDLKNEQKGLLWILDEESIFPGANDSSFLARVYVHHCSDKQSWIKQGPRKDTFYVNHCQGTLPVLYNAKGWLKQAREHSTTKQARGILSESSRPHIADMFSNRNTLGDSSISRSRSFKRTSMTPPTAIKKNSQCLQLIYQVDTILEAIRKTKVNFVRTIVPDIDDGTEPDADKKTKDLATLDVPLARQQLRAAEMMDAIRIHRQGYPEHMPFAEFRRRFDILAPSESRNTGPVLDEKKGVEALLQHLDLDKRSYRLGLSQIFFRAGSLAQLEDARDEKNTGTIVELQSLCRGFLARRKFKKLQVQNRAMICIQRNLLKFAAVRDWPWWRLYTKVLPLLNVHRAEEELKSKSTEVDGLKAKIVKLENENRELNVDNEKLEQKVNELSAALAEDHAASNHANQVLEQETMERMRLERSLDELKESYDEMKKQNNKLQKDLVEARSIASSASRPLVKLERYEGEGASNDEYDEDDEEDTFYRDRYIQASRQHDELRRRIQSESDKVVEDLNNQKRQLERKLTEEKAENDELQRSISGLKKKTSRLNAEMEDLKLLLEEEQSRNGELEKKQRKFDIEANRFKEEVNHERNLKDKINREKEKYQADKYRLEKEIELSKEELERLTKENDRLNQEINDMSANLGTKTDGDSLALKKSIRELEQKVLDQEEELDEQAGQIHILEQTKLRLEMASERDKKQVQKELESKEEEVEDIRATMQKKVKQLEAQLEDEYQEKTSSVKAKRDMERRLQELRDSYERDNAENERRLRRELKRTKALLRDSQTVIDTLEKKVKDKNQVKILKDQLEDAEYSAQVALKAKKKIEDDFNEVQSQLDAITKTKIEVENKYFTQLKETTSLQSRVEEDEEEIETLTEKNRQMLKQLSTTETQLREMDNLLQDAIADKEQLESKISTMSTRMAYLEGSTVDKQQLSSMDSKMRELETKLDMEGTSKRRQDVQVNRLKEQILRLQEERDDVLLRESKLSQENLKLDRHMREMKEEAELVEKRENEWKKKKSEMEREMETLEVDLSSTKQELSLSKKRVAELQQALEDDMNYDSEGLSQDDSDLSDDLDSHIETASAVPSEPRSYRSIEDLDDDDELELKLKKRLTEIKDTTDTPTERWTSSTRKSSASASLSPKSDDMDKTKLTGEPKRRRSDHKSREDRRKKSIEKRKSLERMSRKAKGDTPGAFDI